MKSAAMMVVLVTLLYYVPFSIGQHPTIVQLVKRNDQFKLLALALEAAGVTEANEMKGPYTLFAPNDAAFAKVPVSVVERLSDPKNVEELFRVLSYHVVVGRALTAAQLQAMSSPTRLKTLADDFLTVAVRNNQVKINNATVVAKDLQASNGIIHTIDSVLMPPATSG
ncbi:unnamed protein product [Rotaria socialis]|uniref:FAS1 domain-containing protein n=3 Tax=Rotaria socialis TaxID=392032 RepID=A0A818AEM4_9BILA|nr:unnamed protein product [Rotaria socialis]CAF3395205.1 unnamed protein product [Rotaria socialis]CAF3406425.1 unnamed protein product [Rotaria socialis]CAF3514647.1 unnamed protein product [Rotaria socialis]CAF3673747.1 unnamed protein product [Rotaria socialis]